MVYFIYESDQKTYNHICFAYGDTGIAGDRLMRIFSNLWWPADIQTAGGTGYMDIDSRFGYIRHYVNYVGQ